MGNQKSFLVTIFRRYNLIFMFFLYLTPAYAETIETENLIDMSAPVVATVGTIDFRDCLIESAARDRTVQCAWYEVPENHDEPEGKRIQLFITRLPAKKSKKAVDPVLFLAGGPGQSASEAYLHIDYKFGRLNKDRDFYLIDQRGTGHSNYLGCNESLERQYEQFAYEQDAEKIKALLQQCFDELPGDSRFYTTSVAIQDFESVRSALSIKQWNLFGVSYGTRSGIHYMRKHPGAIRTAMLDSLVPPDLPLLQDIATNSQKTLSVLFQRCHDNIDCVERFPDLENEITSLFSRLEETPVITKVENFRTGQLEDISFHHNHLAILIRLYLYSADSLAVLPPLLYETSANNNFAPLLRTYNNLMSSFAGIMAPGMHNAVICTEDYPFLQANEQTLARDEQTYIGARILEAMQLSCDIWPQGVMDEDFKEPLVSDIPTLLISGEHDPITPPENGEIVKASLSNATHWVLKAQGHFPSVEGCVPYLISNFVTSATTTGMDASCLERIEATPLFTNFNGPSP